MHVEEGPWSHYEEELRTSSIEFAQWTVSLVEASGKEIYSNAEDDVGALIPSTYL